MLGTHAVYSCNVKVIDSYDMSCVNCAPYWGCFTILLILQLITIFLFPRLLPCDCDLLLNQEKNITLKNYTLKIGFIPFYIL